MARASTSANPSAPDAAIRPGASTDRPAALSGTASAEAERVGASNAVICEQANGGDFVVTETWAWVFHDSEVWEIMASGGFVDDLPTMEALAQLARLATERGVVG